MSECPDCLCHKIMRMLVKNTGYTLAVTRQETENYADSHGNFRRLIPKTVIQFKERLSGVYQFYTCIRQRKRISHEKLSLLSLYKNLNTCVAQWLLKSDPIAILRLLIFHKGYRNLPECIELRGADVLLAFPQIGPTTGIQKSFCVVDILPTVSCLGFIFSVYRRASALARMCDSLHISTMYCINLDECHVLRMCVSMRIYIYTIYIYTIVCKTYVQNVTRSCRTKQELFH